jgi:hypothetical protein
MDNLHLDRKIVVKWDHTQGLMASYGGAAGFRSSIAQVIANAVQRGGCYAR